MIQIYKPENSNFKMNGDAILRPISCIASFSINGAWTLELHHPIDENIQYIVENSVLCVPTPYGKRQLYRIYSKDKSDSEIIAYAYPIFLDSRYDCYLFDVRPTNEIGQDALNKMLASNSKYKAQCNIKKYATSYYVQKNFIEALNGEDENSFINRWGGEIAYDNYTLIVNERLGADNGMRAEFGFNLTGIKEMVDMSNVVTRIIPQAYNGYMLPDNEVVDSPLINKYPIIYTRNIEYSNIMLKEDAKEDDLEDQEKVICDTLEELYEALKQACNAEFESGIDKPNITYEVSIADISKTDQYKEFENLLELHLGDTVHAKNKRLDIMTEARCIEMTWDCILESVESVVLGDFEANYFNETSSIINSASKVIDTKNNSLMGEKISGVINLLNTSLKAQKSIAKKQDTRAILFEDIDPESDTFGALAIGTQGIQISKIRNETDTDWIWGTAINFESIIADYIVTGILADRTGTFYLNMDTGELIMNSGTFKGKIDVKSDVGVGDNMILRDVTKKGQLINFENVGYVSGHSDNKTLQMRLNDSSDILLYEGGISLRADVIGLQASDKIIAYVPIETSSDLSLKENIKNIQISSLVDEIKIKRFDFIDGKKNVVGVVAQDLENSEFSKYIISKNRNGLLSVDYNVLSMACIQKVQELEKRVLELERSKQ